MHANEDLELQAQRTVRADVVPDPRANVPVGIRGEAIPVVDLLRPIERDLISRGSQPHELAQGLR